MTLQPATRRIVYGLLALFGLLAVGVVGYRVLEGMSLTDALYMTVITITTVGFEEVKPLSEAGRIFTLGLIVGGVGPVAYSLGTLAGSVIDGEWRVHWRRRRRQQMMSQLATEFSIDNLTSRCAVACLGACDPKVRENNLPRVGNVHSNFCHKVKR